MAAFKHIFNAQKQTGGNLLLAILAGFAFLCILINAGCGVQNNQTQPELFPRTKEITVSAAASLQDAFREIGALYGAQTGIKVNFNFASSGALQKQIEQGAPVDVFASAGKQQMEALGKQGFLKAGEDDYVNFVRNELVLIVPANSQTKTLNFAEFLENEKVRLAIGNPKTVPAGQYAAQSLERLGIWQKLQPRLILAEDVRQVLDYVSRGEVEAGIVYATDLKAAQGRVREAARPPESSYDPIFYPITVLKDSPHRDAAIGFLLLVVRDEGQQILERHGFIALRQYK